VGIEVELEANLRSFFVSNFISFGG
jgi:hypothetical protein